MKLKVFFHERRALSHYEKRYATRSQLRDFNVEEMKYEDSLQQAITQMENELKQQHTEYAKLALDNLNSLKKTILSNINKIFLVHFTSFFLFNKISKIADFTSFHSFSE